MSLIRSKLGAGWKAIKSLFGKLKRTKLYVLTVDEDGVLRAVFNIPGFTIAIETKDDIRFTSDVIGFTFNEKILSVETMSPEIEF